MKTTFKLIILRSIVTMWGKYQFDFVTLHLTCMWRVRGLLRRLTEIVKLQFSHRHVLHKFCFVDRASQYVCIIQTNLMHYLSSVYFISQPLHGKAKAVLLQAWSGPEGGRLSALCTGYLTPRKYPWYSFLLEAELTPRTMVRSEGFYVDEKSTDTSWDRTSDPPICITAP